MHITIELEAATKFKPAIVREARQPYHNADHLIVDGKCPLCNTDPFRVVGKIDEQTHTHDMTTAPALVQLRDARRAYACTSRPSFPASHQTLNRTHRHACALEVSPPVNEL